MGTVDVFVLVRAVVGSLLVIAGLAKLRDRVAFIRAVSDVRLLSGKAVRFVGAIVPPVEVGIGTLLIIGWQTPALSVLSAMLFVAFASFAAVALLQTTPATCGCFGRRGEVSPGLVVRNVGLALLALTSGALPVIALTAAAMLLIALGSISPLMRSAASGDVA